jgi:inosose dehydratase
VSAILNRRQFAQAAAGMGLWATVLRGAAQRARNIKIGHTGITWPNNQIDQAIRDIAGLGFHSLETFGNVIEGREAAGGLGPVLEQNKLSLLSAYCGANLTDPARRDAEREKMLTWGRLIKKYGGKISVIGPNNVPRNTFDFNANKANIVAALNDYSKALTEIGLTAVLHQHTGTCVETRDETYAVMEAVDTRYVKFGPDVGQLQKGGADPVKVVKDFLPVIEHMYLKDFSGGQHYEGYSPLGEGKVDLVAILDLMEGKQTAGMVMVELDSSRNMPLNGLETAKIAKAFLQKQGVQFRS